MTFSSIHTSIDTQGVATLTLHAPRTHHALAANMITECLSALSEFAKNPAVKIVLLKSSGKIFCAGADIQALRNLVHASYAENLEDAQQLATLMHTLYYFNKPTLCMVQGPVFGGGVGLVACCQIVIASTLATFCFSEARLGIIPAIISPYIIHAIGLRQARAYFLTATPFDSATALRLGLCHEITPPYDLEHRTTQCIANLLQNGPQALQEVNQLIHELDRFPITSDVITLTTEKMAQLRISAEGQEGLSAFLEKRKPHWIRS